MARHIRALVGTAAIASTVVGFAFARGPSAWAALPGAVTFTDATQQVPNASCAAAPETPERASLLLKGMSVATGIISDTFHVTDCATVTHPPLFQPNATPTAHWERSLQSLNGTIEMTMNGSQTSFDPTTLTETFVGNWVIVAGSGAYAGVHGEGGFVVHIAFLTESVTETDSGQASLG
jgi:hypothetical protein